MSQAELIQIIITALSGVLVPVALLVVGNWYTKQKEKADGAITFRDTPDVAGAALLALGGSDEIPDEVILLELLAPLKVQLDRTREALERWQAQDENTERFVKQSNEYIRDLLISRAYLIPKDLQGAANQLLVHYNNWFKKYDDVYKDGIRDPKVSHVFTRDFPHEAERQILAKYDALRSKTIGKTA